jgi:hypothetical protein
MNGPFVCSECGIVAKTDAGLHRHRAGSQLYGGHGIAPTPINATFKAPRTESGEHGKSFSNRVRDHQAWYRENRLKVEAYVHADVLSPEDAERGLNFLSASIFDYARRRADENPQHVKRSRCFGHMRSSQPMCFNLLAPLANDLDLASRLLRTLLPGEVEAVTRVVVEHTPAPKADHLGDNTSLDALIVFRRPDGRRVLLGIETKLTDSFSTKRYDGRPRYHQITSEAAAIWKQDTTARLPDPAWNQLWRNQMLLEAMIRQPEPPGDEARLVVVHHQDDLSCRDAIDGYKDLLIRPTETFAEWPLDLLIERWGTAVSTPPERAWLAGFADRYVNLNLSATQLVGA